MELKLKTANGSIKTVNFKVRGYSYIRKKASARRLGDEIAALFGEGGLTDIQIDVVKDIMTRIAKKWGLIAEFRELGVCK